MVSQGVNISIEDYNYNLPEEKIAKFPLEIRDRAKLLVLRNGAISKREFFELPQIIDKDNLLIYNNTKVVHARLFFKKETGSVIEIFCLEPYLPNEINIAFAQREKGQWKCFVGNNKKWKTGELVKRVTYNNKELILSAKRIKQEDNAWIIEFNWNESFSFAEILGLMGVIPLPPYLNREAIESDNSDYQTIYAKEDGSVAAPTAGLHFTERTFNDLREKGIKSRFITLHVGAGTFKPVSTENISEHIMHTEKIEIPKTVIQDIINYIDKGITCIGTTSVRTIESLYWHGVRLMENGDYENEIDIKQWEPYNREVNIETKEALNAIIQRMDKEKTNHLYGQTQIIIMPGYKYRIVKAMVTNFHQPKSTLLLLVSAMIGEKWKEAYKFALENDFRFLSFGDACLFENNID